MRDISPGKATKKMTKNMMVKEAKEMIRHFYEYA
jgi:hypothetical protein